LQNYFFGEKDKKFEVFFQKNEHIFIDNCFYEETKEYIVIFISDSQ